MFRRLTGRFDVIFFFFSAAVAGFDFGGAAEASSRFDEFFHFFSAAVAGFDFRGAAEASSRFDVGYKVTTRLRPLVGLDLTNFLGYEVATQT